MASPASVGAVVRTVVMVVVVETVHCLCRHVTQQGYEISRSLLVAAMYPETHLGINVEEHQEYTGNMSDNAFHA